MKLSNAPRYYKKIDRSLLKASITTLFDLLRKKKNGELAVFAEDQRQRERFCG